MPQVLAERIDFPNEIVLDATHAYVQSSNGSIFKVPLGGGTKEEVAPALRKKEGLAVDGTSIWTDGEEVNANVPSPGRS